SWYCTQYLRTMTEGSDRLILLDEMSYNIEHFLMSAKIFGCSASRYHQTVVRLDIISGLFEVAIQCEIVPQFLGVGLGTIEVVDGRLDCVSLLLSRTYSVHIVAHHQQHLERHHRWK